MLQYSQCKLDYRRDSIEELRKKIAEILRIRESEINRIKILKKSIDARKKPQIYYSYSVAFECAQEQKVLQKNKKDKNLSVYVSQPSLEDMVPKLKKEAGERVVIVDDVMTSGASVEERVERLRSRADIQVAAVIVIINRRNQMPAGTPSGEERMLEKYGAKVYSLITDEDIEAAFRERIV